MRSILLILSLLTACSTGGEQLATVKQLRSATAEWALVNAQAARQHLPAAYVDGMRQAARDQIKKAAQSLDDPHSEAARRAAALQALAPDASFDLLSREAAALKAIEDQLESA
jgi:hypothetical protein